MWKIENLKLENKLSGKISRAEQFFLSDQCPRLIKRIVCIRNLPNNFVVSSLLLLSLMSMKPFNSFFYLIYYVTDGRHTHMKYWFIEWFFNLIWIDSLCIWHYKIILYLPNIRSVSWKIQFVIKLNNWICFLKKYYKTDITKAVILDIQCKIFWEPHHLLYLFC